MEVHPDLVRQGLYLSSLRTEVYRDVLDAHGITHILQVGFELRPTHPKIYTYLQLPVYDIVEQDIVAHFPKAFDFIDKAISAGGVVLVHCQAGISRSATVVIGYCMWKDKLSAVAATAAVQHARSCIWPNAGFKCQLREFEAMHYDVSRWKGWSMQKYLHQQYGDDSVGFMSSMLGGAPVDRLRGSSNRAEPLLRPKPAAPPGHAAASPNCGVAVRRRSVENSCAAAVSALMHVQEIQPARSHAPASSSGSGGSHHHSTRAATTTSTCCHTSNTGSHLPKVQCSSSLVKVKSRDPYAVAASAAAAAAAAAGVSSFSGSSSSIASPGVGKEAALMMAG